VNRLAVRLGVRARGAGGCVEGLRPQAPSRLITARNLLMLVRSIRSTRSMSTRISPIRSLSSCRIEASSVWS